MTTDMWSAYVRRLLELSGQSEAAFVRDLAVPQGTFNRWKNGLYVPTKAADVAQFATDCGRNVLEAFVAAGMLTFEEAGRGLSAASRRFLERLDDDGGSVSDLRGPVSDGPPSLDDAMAAHPDQGDIAGEQDRHHDT